MTDPVHLGDNVTLYLADCLEVMRGMPDRSVDAVVTDPPYGHNNNGDLIQRWGDGMSDRLAEIEATRKKILSEYEFRGQTMICSCC